MEKLRKIEFYTSDKYDPQAGFMDGGDEDDNKTAIGLFHRFADSYHIDNGRYYPLTEAIIEDEATGEVKQIESKRVIRFVKEWYLHERFVAKNQKELEKPYLRNSKFDPFDNRASLVSNYWSCFRYRSNYFQSLFWWYGMGGI